MTTTAEPEVLEGTKIVPTVELQLTKSDLVDMVVAEQEELVEAEMDSIEKDLAATEKEIEAATEKHKKALVAELKRAHGKRIRAAEKFFGAKAKLSTRHSGGGRGYRPYKQYDYTVYNSRRRKTTQTVQYHETEVSNRAYAEISPDCLAGDRNGEQGSWHLKVKFTEKDLEALPTAKELTKLGARRVALIKRKADMESAMSNIETMGQRAKARMVRQVLAGSKQGQQLLKSMPKLDAARLLPPAPKK